jgi:ribosomal protein S27AE
MRVRQKGTLTSCRYLRWKEKIERNYDMNAYIVRIQIEQVDEDGKHSLELGRAYEAGKFDTEAKAVEFVENQLIKTQVTDSAADLLEACKGLASYTMDLLYKLDDQVDFGDVEEIQQARAAIAGYSSGNTRYTRLRNACQQMLDTLDIGGEQSRAFAQEIQMLRDTLSVVPTVKAECPRCGAGSDERELVDKDLSDIELIYLHYLCNRCGSRIIEEFKPADVLIDDLPISWPHPPI